MRLQVPEPDHRALGRGRGEMSQGTAKPPLQSWVLLLNTFPGLQIFSKQVNRVDSFGAF